MSTHPITIDRHLSFENMIAAGCYSWSSSEISRDHFPFMFKGTRRIQSTIALVLFDEYADSREVLKAFEIMRLRAARLPEFLALGA